MANELVVPASIPVFRLVPEGKLDPEVLAPYKEAKKLSKTDRQTVQALEAAISGDTVISLHQTIRASYEKVIKENRQVVVRGTDVNAVLPPLAFARADSTVVRMKYRTSGALRFKSKETVELGNVAPPHNFDLAITARSAVPPVPLALRPDNLKDHYLLWEVEWANVRAVQKPEPRDADPILLVRIAPDVYQMKASWDLTPLEQALMWGRIK